MTRPPRISLDAMGGDNAPDIVVQGADKVLAVHPNISLIFVGDERRVRPLLDRSEHLRSAEIVHTDEEVAAEAKPSQARRQIRPRPYHENRLFTHLYHRFLSVKSLSLFGSPLLPQG